MQSAYLHTLALGLGTNVRRDVTTALKMLRLHGMVGAWTDLLAQRESSVAASKWLIEHLLQAEHTDRAMRSISHQMKAARFSIHRDLAGFDFASTKVEENLVSKPRSWSLPRQSCPEDASARAWADFFPVEPKVTEPQYRAWPLSTHSVGGVFSG